VCVCFVVFSCFVSSCLGVLSVVWVGGGGGGGGGEYEGGKDEGGREARMGGGRQGWREGDIQ